MNVCIVWFSEGSSVAGIAAGFIIGALVLVVIIIAVICIRKKQSKKPKGMYWSKYVISNTNMCVVK